MSTTRPEFTASDAAFVERARNLLEQGNARLDARVRSRLTRARHEALAQARPAAHLWWQNLAPAGALAAAVVLAVLVWPIPRPVTEDSVPAALMASSALDDLEIVLADDSLELYEDLDFYEWLGATETI